MWEEFGGIVGDLACLFDAFQTNEFFYFDEMERDGWVCVICFCCSWCCGVWEMKDVCIKSEDKLTTITQKSLNSA
jgi:hypothetical protein